MKTYLCCEKTGELLPCKILMLGGARSTVKIECEGVALWVEAGEIATRAIALQRPI